MSSPFGGDVIGNPVSPVGEPKGPSTLGYWLGGGIIAVGIVGAIAWGVTQFMAFQDEVDGFERVTVGDRATVTFEEGDYVLYAERGGGSPLGFFLTDVEIRPDEEGADPIVLEDYTSELTYDFTRSGRAQSTFEIEETGDYVVTVGGGPGNSATTAAFGPSVADNLALAIGGAFAIAVAGIVIGVIILAVTGVRRRKWRQRTWRDAWNGPPPPGQSGVWNPAASAQPPAWGQPAPAPPQAGSGYPPPPPG